MADEPKDQNTPFTWDKLLTLFMPKVLDWGVPGGFIAIALLKIKDGKPEEAPLFFGLSIVAWIVLRIGNQLAPRFEKFLEWGFNNSEKAVLDTWARFTDSFEGKYYERLKFDCREYENRGINRGGLQLANVFVPLKLSEKEARRISQNLIGNQQFDKQQEIGTLLVQMTDKHCSCPRLAILGAPGSGKSTLLRHLALMYATRRQRSLHPKAPKLVPVLLQLRDIYQEILDNPEIPLVDVITVAVKNLQKSEPLKPRPRWFSTRLRNKTCLVMLDGLDEIADDEHRQQISQWVDRQIRDYRTTPFILTSRPEGYRTARLQENVIELEVQPFDVKQRNAFVKNWYFHRKKREYGGKVDLGVKDSALRQAEDLIAQIENSLTLRLMATNPLLLNMIAIAHEDNRSLSTRRVDLYREICRVLLEGRQRAKRQPTILSADQKQLVLQALALRMMESETQSFTLGKSRSRGKVLTHAGDLIAEKLRGFPQQRMEPEAFIRKDDLGVRELLSEREQEGVYEFAHKTFQEFLAAVAIDKSGQEAILFQAFTDESKLAWWRETIRFYAVQTPDATNLVREALRQGTLPILTLVSEVWRDAQYIAPEVQAELQNKFERGLESDDPEVFRLAASVLLANRLNRFYRQWKERDRSTEQSVLFDRQYLTWAEYKLFFLGGKTIEGEEYIFGKPKDPVINLSFIEVNSFCAWLSLEARKLLGEPSVCFRAMTIKECQQNRCDADESDRNLAFQSTRLVLFDVPERYTRLADYLAAGQWQKADRETYEVMLKVAGREKARYLDLDDIRKFPCEDLQTIDQLWVTYSNGQFGFSVQKEIWLAVGGWLEGDRSRSLLEMLPSPVQSLINRFGGRLSSDLEIYYRFAESVGWIEHQQIISYSDAIFDTDAPKGHLPAFDLNSVWWAGGGCGAYLLSRRDL